MAVTEVKSVITWSPLLLLIAGLPQTLGVKDILLTKTKIDERRQVLCPSMQCFCLFLRKGL